MKFFRCFRCDRDGIVERVRRRQLPLHVDGDVHEVGHGLRRRRDRKKTSPEHGDGRHKEEKSRFCRKRVTREKRSINYLSFILANIFTCVQDKLRNVSNG